MIGDDETNFSHKLSLTNRQVATLCKVFTDKSSTDNIALTLTAVASAVDAGIHKKNLRISQ